MVAINAHYDGKFIVPDEPLDLAPNQRVRVQIEPIPSGDHESVLDWIVKNPMKDDDLPSDLSYQHDHYLYGTPKKP
jgi:hypothetical protein